MFHRLFVFGAALGLVAVMGSGCSDPADRKGAGIKKEPHNHSDHSAAGRHEHDQLLMIADDPMAHASLGEVAAASDLVIRGSITGTREGIRFGDGPGTLTYTEFTVEPTKVLSGDGTDAIRVLMITKSPDGQRIELLGRPDLVGPDALWMLRAVDPYFQMDEAYVLTSLGGVIPIDDGEVVVEAEIDTPAVREAAEFSHAGRLTEYLSDGLPG